jgi:hypothetical protein
MLPKQPLLLLDLSNLCWRWHGKHSAVTLVEWFANGGYVRRVTIILETGIPLVWRLSISRTSPSMTDVLTTMSMFERPDALGTACPPDMFSQELKDKFGCPAGSIDNDRILFNAALHCASPLSCLGCCHYVSGANPSISPCD